MCRELRHYWGVETADVPPGDYGWGFVKLEPLFGRTGERFLVLDSDTVLTGPLLDLWKDNASPFLVDDEEQTDADTRRLYYDWDKLRAIDPRASKPAFVFNSGQWFGTAGLLTRDDFAPWVEWTMPRRLRHPDSFMPGDQGVLNYVLNQTSSHDGLTVDRRKIMVWPGHGMNGIDAASVSRSGCPALVIHWAGLKRARHRDMAGADLLGLFERTYYGRLPGGGPRRMLAVWQDAFSQSAHAVRVWGLLAWRQIRSNELFTAARGR